MPSMPEDPPSSSPPDSTPDGVPDSPGDAPRDAAVDGSAIVAADAPRLRVISSSSDDIDPELVRLPPARPRRSPIVSLAVIAVGAMVLWQLRADIGFALSPSAPQTLALSAVDTWPDNRLVSVEGIPDYRNALMFEPKGDRYRRSFFRLLGTGDRVLVRADETSTRTDLSERFVGRLRRFEDIAFQGDVRRYYGDFRIFCTKYSSYHL